MLFSCQGTLTTASPGVILQVFAMFNNFDTGSAPASYIIPMP